MYEELHAEDFTPGLYRDTDEIIAKYWNEFKTALKARDKEAAFEAFKTAVSDGYQLGKSESETNEFSDNL